MTANAEADPANAPAADKPALTHRETLWIVLGVLVPVLMASVDQTVRCDRPADDRPRSWPGALPALDRGGLSAHHDGGNAALRQNQRHQGPAGHSGRRRRDIHDWRHRLGAGAIDDLAGGGAGDPGHRQWRIGVAGDDRCSATSPRQRSAPAITPISRLPIPAPARWDRRSAATCRNIGTGAPLSGWRRPLGLLSLTLALTLLGKLPRHEKPAPPGRARRGA